MSSYRLASRSSSDEYDRADIRLSFEDAGEDWLWLYTAGKVDSTCLVSAAAYRPDPGSGSEILIPVFLTRLFRRAMRQKTARMAPTTPTTTPVIIAALIGGEIAPLAASASDSSALSDDPAVGAPDLELDVEDVLVADVRALPETDDDYTIG